MKKRLVGVFSDQPQSGKSTFTEILIDACRQNDIDTLQICFATPVKETLLTLLKQLGEPNPVAYLWDNKKDVVIPTVGITGGQLMSTFATDYMRAINPDIWLNVTKREYTNLKNFNGLVIIDDLRFSNEWTWIDDQISWIVKIDRPDLSHTRSEMSEGQLKGFGYNYIVHNNCEKEKFLEQCKLIARDIVGCFLFS